MKRRLTPTLTGSLTVTMTDAARLIGVNRDTLYEWQKKGKLPLEIRYVNGRPRVLTASIAKALAI